MKSTFKLPEKSSILDYSWVEKASEKTSNSKIEFGSYQNVQPLSRLPIFIHYSHDRPLPLFKNVTRTVTVSHWESIQVDEYYEVYNQIAKLVGEFGRIDYNEWTNSYAIRNFKSSLPVQAHNLYYVDAIGNISESNAYRGANEVHFEIRPWFPIMGGWKTSWNQGYSLPAINYISYNEQDPNQFVFTTWLSHQFEGITA